MSNQRKDLPTKSSRNEVTAFLRKVAATPAIKTSGEQGRLVFAMDATASRAPTWDRACHIQAQMFKETTDLGGLSIQLAYYRGFEEFHISRWHNNPTDLLQQMSHVVCLGGMTQLTKVLQHVINETKKTRVQALVFVGDCVEENPALLEQLAGQLTLLGVPAFIFQEGNDPLAEQVFRQISSLTGGAYCRFGSGSAQELHDLLNAVAVFVAGGRKALENYSREKSNGAKLLTQQLQKSK